MPRIAATATSRRISRDGAGAQGLQRKMVALDMRVIAPRHATLGGSAPIEEHDSIRCAVMRRRHQLVAVPKLTAAATSVASPAVTGRTGDRVFEADVDGARVRICARDEVVIACGQASITLRRNGRVVIRGTTSRRARRGPTGSAVVRCG